MQCSLFFCGVATITVLTSENCCKPYSAISLPCPDILKPPNGA